MMVKYSRVEVAKHCNKTSTWIIMDNKVYDVTNFLSEHPGGEAILLQWAGQDATGSFNDVGHSADARAMTADYLIGELEAEELLVDNNVVPEVAMNEREETWLSILASPTWINLLIPMALSVGVYVFYNLCN